MFSCFSPLQLCLWCWPLVFNCKAINARWVRVCGAAAESVAALVARLRPLDGPGVATQQRLGAAFKSAAPLLVPPALWLHGAVALSLVSLLVLINCHQALLLPIFSFPCVFLLTISKMFSVHPFLGRRLAASGAVMLLLTTLLQFVQHSVDI